MSTARLVAVLGYTNGGAGGVHEICAARLGRAEREARAGDLVLLSGWGHENVAGDWAGTVWPLGAARTIRTRVPPSPRSA